MKYYFKLPNSQMYHLIKDASSLETAKEKTAVIRLLYSKGYFRIAVKRNGGFQTVEEIRL